MGSKSYENGKKGERIVSDFLCQRRYWVHNVQRRPNGSQPVDIIALKENTSLLLDAKYVNASKKDYFPFSDVQSDQETSMEYAIEYASLENVGFAIVLEIDEQNPRYLDYCDYIRVRYEEGKEGVRALNLPLLEDIA